MQHRLRRRSIALFVLCLATAFLSAAEPTDDEVRDLLIRASIARYPGNCPCPYFTDRAGRRCGARSAYSRQGGYDVLCYAEDVTPEMIKKYRELNK